jgi:DNA polymerase III epsilon subunit-like protein
VEKTKAEYLSNINSFVVIDIETLGSNSNPSRANPIEVCAVGVVRNQETGAWPVFTEAHTHVPSTDKHLPIDIYQSMYCSLYADPKEVDPNTYDFHRKILGVTKLNKIIGIDELGNIDKNIMNLVRNSRAHTAVALNQFFESSFIDKNTLVAAWRPQFDLPRLEALNDYKPLPFSYRNVIDIATLSNFHEPDYYDLFKSMLDELAPAHNAYNDCLREAFLLARILNDIEAELNCRQESPYPSTTPPPIPDNIGSDGKQITE